MFRIFGSRYPSALKPQFLLTLSESPFVSEGCVGYSSVQKFHALSEQLDIFLFYTALLLILFDFLHELLQNYLFLEVFQMLTHCHCKPS